MDILFNGSPVLAVGEVAEICTSKPNLKNKLGKATFCLYVSAEQSTVQWSRKVICGKLVFSVRLLRPLWEQCYKPPHFYWRLMGSICKRKERVSWVTGLPSWQRELLPEVEGQGVLGDGVTASSW